jgi:tRNA (cytidine32/uridine32-2'-O)-methyltransferase
MEINILRGILTSVQKAVGAEDNRKSTEAEAKAAGQEDGHV